MLSRALSTASAASPLVADHEHITHKAARAIHSRPDSAKETIAPSATTK